MQKRIGIISLLAFLFVSLNAPHASVAEAYADASPVGVWDLCGQDEADTGWIATLVLSLGEDDTLVGYVDWLGDNGHSGREYVTGSFEARTRSLDFEGTRVENSDGVVRSEYHAVVSTDGGQLEQGTWVHKDVTIPGTWRASRIRL